MNGYDRLKLQYKENLNTDKALIKIIKYLLCFSLSFLHS